MDVLHHHLEAIEAARFGDLNFSGKSLGQIFYHNSIRRCEERQHVLDKVLLVFAELLPVLDVLTEVNFVDSPEAGHLILVHLPNVFVMDRKDNEAVWVLLEKWLWQRRLRKLALAHLLRGDYLLL